MGRSVHVLLCVLTLAQAPGCRLSSEEVRADDAGPSVPDAAVAATPDAAAGLPVRAGNSLVTAENDVLLRAQFWAESSGPGSCLNEEVSGCTVRICEAIPDGGWPTAGPITVSSPIGQAVMTPDETGRYGTADDPVTWLPGDAIRFAADGDAVPAFDETLTGPALLETLVQPAAADSSATVPRDRPLAVEWTGGTEYVAAYLTCLPTETSRLQLRCDMPEGATTGSVPAEVLARMPAGCPDGLFFLTAEDHRFIEPGDGYLIKLAARSPSLKVHVTLE